MQLLDPNDPIKAGLEQLCSPIALIARDCVETIFGQSCIIHDNWSIIDRLRGDFPHNIYLGCANDNYQAIATLGTGEREMREFIGTCDRNSILDAFGEMLNVYLGMLMDNDMFTGRFGILTQSIPHYSADMSYYSQAWGCHGNLVTPKNGSLYMGFAVKGSRARS